MCWAQIWRARRVAYLGCAAALGYEVLMLIWSLGGTAGLRDPEVLRATYGGHLISVEPGAVVLLDDAHHRQPAAR